MRLPPGLAKLVVPLLSLTLLTGCLGFGAEEEPAQVVDDPAVETAATDAEETAPAPAEPTPSTEPSSPPASANAPANGTSANASAELPPPPPPPRVDVLTWNGSITSVSPGGNANGMSACCNDVVVEQENAEGTFELPAGAKGIVVELAWSDPQFDLDLVLEAPDVETLAQPEPDGTRLRMKRGHIYGDTDGNAGEPDGRAVILLTDAEALALTGTWTWRVHTKTANAVAFAVAVSLFHDTVPAESHSALAG